MLPSKSREHRIRVLENLTKHAAGREMTSAHEQLDPQMRMPLIVEVKSATTAKQRLRRPRSGSGKDQPELGDI
jgi:hypothetical protein